MQDKEYWASRLNRFGERLGKFTKIHTHRKERRHGKLQCIYWGEGKERRLKSIHPKNI